MQTNYLPAYLRPFIYKRNQDIFDKSSSRGSESRF